MGKKLLKLAKRTLMVKKPRKWVVSDEIVIDLVKKQISQIEKEQKSWIIEGFPRTRV